MTDTTEAARFLDQHGITFERDGDRIVVPGDLILFERGLTALPDLSKVEVEGGFYVGCNKLTSLKGAPQKVGSHFDCSLNELTTLEGAPAAIPGVFECSRNKLTSLEHSPRTVGSSFYCNDNMLTSLKGGPTAVLGTYFAFHNPLISLEGAPTVKGGYLDHDGLPDADGKRRGGRGY